MLRFLKRNRGHVVPLRLGQDRNGSSPAADHTGARALSLSAPAPALVLGLGNVLLSDDGAGVRLLEQLRAELGADAANFIDGGTLSFSLLTYIESTDSMLAIDAADLDSAPGTTKLLEGEAMDRFLASSRRRTVHEVGLIDLLDMARLHECLPSRRALLCIQPYRIDWSETLSAPVAQSLPAAGRQAQALLQRWRIT
jgi:hydrogenase maturation protease